MNPPTPEQAFAYGADAMRSRCIALMMMERNLKLAQMVMALDLPKVQWPESFIISEEEGRNESAS